MGETACSVPSSASPGSSSTDTMPHETTPPDAENIEAYSLLERSSRTHALLRAAIAPVMLGLALGVTYGNIGGALVSPAFKARYHSPEGGALGLLAASNQLGCIFGSIVAGWVADRWGRRPSILGSAAVLLLSTFVLGVPLVSDGDSLAPLFAGRILSGLAGGIASTTVPLHVSECAVAEWRGGTEASFQLAIEFGILGAYVLNYLTVDTRDGWIASLALAPAVPAALFLVVAVPLLPESPRWLLVARGEHERAAATLASLRAVKTEAVHAELDAIAAAEAEAQHGGRAVSWRALLSREQRRPVLVAMTVLALQVGTGIDFVTVFAPTIFGGIFSAGGSGGGSDDDPSRELLYTLLVGVVFVVVTPFAVAGVDRFGRRPLLLAGGGGMSASLLGLAVAYGIMDQSRDGAAELGAVAAAGSAVASAAPALCVGLLLLYVVFFSFSWGPIAWVVPSELLHYRVRAKVVAAGTVANWVSDYVVVATFPLLVGALGHAGSFAVYCVVNVLAVVFVYVFVPETKGMELEAIS